ncbi:MAG TPA: hypothetical protein VGE21_05895 [Flavobacteriales bacterium]
MKRLAAFTLIEMLLSLLLVVLLGAFVVIVLQGSAIQWTRLGSGHRFAAEMRWFVQRMSADMERAQRVQGHPGGIHLALPEGDITYVLSTDSVVRTSVMGDEVFHLRLVPEAVIEHPRAQGLIISWGLRSVDPLPMGAWVFNKDYDARSILRYLVDHGDPYTDTP